MPGRRNGGARLRMRGDLILGEWEGQWLPLLTRAELPREALEKGAFLLWEEK